MSEELNGGESTAVHRELVVPVVCRRADTCRTALTGTRTHNVSINGPDSDDKTCIFVAQQPLLVLIEIND